MKNSIGWNEYRTLSFSDLKKDEYRHVLLLLYWPLYGFLFLYIERLAPGGYAPVHAAIDDAIPFCEGFIIPYLLWFPYLAGMLLYTFFRDVDSFRRLMMYFILTFTAAVVIYRLFPSCQQLRPESMPRENLLTRLTAALYWIDTPANVCPSEHVIGSAGVVFAAWNADRLRKQRWPILLLGVLICVSTVFVKQHSVLDHLGAVPVCLAGWLLCFRRKTK